MHLWRQSSMTWPVPADFFAKCCITDVPLAMQHSSVFQEGVSVHFRKKPCGITPSATAKMKFVAWWWVLSSHLLILHFTFKPRPCMGRGNGWYSWEFLNGSGTAGQDISLNPAPPGLFLYTRPPGGKGSDPTPMLSRKPMVVSSPARRRSKALFEISPKHTWYFKNDLHSRVKVRSKI